MYRLGAHYDRYASQSVTGSNSPSHEQNDYNNVFRTDFNQQLSTTHEPSVQYVPVDYYLTVSSRDRDAVQYPSVSTYMVQFPTEFKNITEIELIQAIIPHKNDVEKEPYLLLKIEELEDVMVSKDRNISDAFAILQMSPPVTTGGFIQMDKRIHENTSKIYQTPRANLSRMTISITDCVGAPFVFGTDANPPQKELQNTFVFKLKCLEKQRNVLNHRGVF